MNSTPIPENLQLKICPKCSKLYPATREYFHARGDKLHGYCKECNREHVRAWQKVNPENWRERNRENNRVWREANPERARDYCSAWQKANPDKTRESRHRRRARKIGAEGTHTTAEIREQYTRQHGRCYYAACGHAPLGDTYHVEHVIPLSRGGRNSIDNIVLSCPKCNLSKHDKLPHEWIEGGRLL